MLETLCKTIRDGLDACENATLEQTDAAWSDADWVWEPTHEDLVYIAETVRDAYGRLPTREEWQACDLSLGSQYCDDDEE